MVLISIMLHENIDIQMVKCGCPPIPISTNTKATQTLTSCTSSSVFYLTLWVAINLSTRILIKSILLQPSPAQKVPLEGALQGLSLGSALIAQTAWFVEKGIGRIALENISCHFTLENKACSSCVLQFGLGLVMGEIHSFGLCTQNAYEYIQTEKNKELRPRKGCIAALGKIGL